MAPRNDLRQPFSGQDLVDALKSTLTSIDVNVSFQPQPSSLSKPSFVVCTTGNTCSRAARRGRNKKSIAAVVTMSSPPITVMKCTILVTREGESGLRLEFRWIQGALREFCEPCQQKGGAEPQT